MSIATLEWIINNTTRTKLNHNKSRTLFNRNGAKGFDFGINKYYIVTLV